MSAYEKTLAYLLRRFSILNIQANFTGVITHSDGARCWYSNKNLHRVDGPAVEFPNGEKEYWVHGKHIENETAYWLLVDMMKLKGLT